MSSTKMERGAKRLISGRELSILKYIADRSEADVDRLTVEVSEIVCGCDIRDSDEVWRALYTLEGKCLVEPEPRGDFTSHQWKITDIGKKALDLV